MNQNHSNKSFKSLMEILFVSTRLGFTSFGGPVAHLGYFHEEYIRRRKWMDEKSYADLVALCQFLPGPASSQVGIGIGVMRAGLLGGIVSFIGFTLPSVIALSPICSRSSRVGYRRRRMDSWVKNCCRSSCRPCNYRHGPKTYSRFK